MRQGMPVLLMSASWVNTAFCCTHHIHWHRGLSHEVHILLQLTASMQLCLHRGQYRRSALTGTISTGCRATHTQREINGFAYESNVTFER
jgi:hypothetical protein